MLCLGDSYTIGQSVNVDERFPEQTLALLKKKNIIFKETEILAKTGWTTQNLLHALEAKYYEPGYDFVTLLAGVNDQYQGIDKSLYAKNFETLLIKSIELAGGKNKNVFVLSIPDYGVTPFAKSNRTTPTQISLEIDAFNSINKKFSEKYAVQYLDITPVSRKAETDTTLLASDGLHPSGKMYALWAEMLAAEIEEQLQ